MVEEKLPEKLQQAVSRQLGRWRQGLSEVTESVNNFKSSVEFLNALSRKSDTQITRADLENAHNNAAQITSLLSFFSNFGKDYIPLAAEIESELKRVKLDLARHERLS